MSGAVLSSVRPDPQPIGAVTAVAAYFEGLVADRVALASRGKFAKDIVSAEFAIIARARQIVQEVTPGVEGSEILWKAFAQLFMERAKDLSTTHRAALTEKLGDPFFIDAISYIGSPGGGEKGSAEGLLIHLNPWTREERWTVGSLLRPIVLLDLIAHRSDLMDSLMSSSSYCPAIHFLGKPKGFPKIAILDAFRCVYLELLREHLGIAEALPEIFGCVKPSHMVPNPSRYLQVQKFLFDSHCGFRIVANKDQVLQGTVGKLQDDPDLKHDTMELAARTLEALRNIFVGFFLPLGRLKPSDSPLVLPSKNFAMVIQCLKNYAFNQFLQTWRNCGSENLEPLRIMRLIGMSARSIDDGFVIQWRDGAETTYRGRPEPKDADTDFPLVLATLARWQDLVTAKQPQS